MRPLFIWLLLAAAADTTLVSCSSEKPASEDEQQLRQLLEEDREAVSLSPEQLSDLMEKFGREIGGLMSESIEKLVEKQRQSKDNKAATDEHDLERIKRANELVAKDAESRIAAAGRPSTGELAEFSLSDAYASGKDFLVNKANYRLQQAGAYIGGRMSSLASIAPKLREKLRKAPKALRKMLQWPTFLNFKVKFNKVYKSKMSELYHQMVFLKTQTTTAIHNMKFFFGKTRHLQKATQYADMSEEQYIRKTANNPDRLDEDESELGQKRVAQLEKLKQAGKNIYGGDMQPLLEVSKETSPAEILAKKRAAHKAQHNRRKRDSNDDDDELDEDDEEGPTFSLADVAQGTEGGGDDDDDGEEEEEGEFEDEGEDLGGNKEAELVDDFATGFQNVDLEAKMDIELDDEEPGQENSIDDHKKEEEAQNFAPIDWSQHRCMPKIENQDRCGFCYALVASTISDFYICMWNLKDDPDARPRRMSGRFVSDCGRYLYEPGQELKIDGCAGGIIGQAIKFIREAGIMGFWGYENQRVSHRASFDKDHCVLPRPPHLKGWAPISADFLQNVTLVGVDRDDWATVDLFLHAAGPVIVNLRPWYGFKDYAGGVFDEIQVLPETGTVHSVMIVGRDRDESGRVYYKLRNTHGIPWGEKGYFRMDAKALHHYSTIKGILMPIEA